MFEIICINGYKNLHNAINQFEDNTLNGGVNLIVFDADFAENNGGYDRRKNELEQTISTLAITTELFLFPNNQDDGDFEILLERLIQKEKHKSFFDCYNDYEVCLKGDKDIQYVCPNRKGKLHTYISAMPMSKTKRERLGCGEWLFEEKEYWNLDSEYLCPLKDFLRENIR